MITNDRFYEVLKKIPSEERTTIRRRRNPKVVRRSEREFMLLELPQNPLRVVERVAEIARERLGWNDPQWGIDGESCWVSESGGERSFLEIIEPGHHRQEAELHAALRLLASISNDRNS